MPGIAGIGRKRQETASDGGNRREQFWIEGSQVYLTSVGTAKEDDPYMDSFWIYTFQENGSWTKVLADDEGPLREVPKGTKASYRFGFWAWIHKVIHEENKNDDWQEIYLPDGKTKQYVEDVGQFRMCILPFGKDDMYYNDFVQMYNDWGGDLSKGVIRVIRRGTGRSTNYSLSAQSADLPIPDEALADIDDLPTAWDYMMDNYGVGESSGGGGIPEGAESLDGGTDSEEASVDESKKLPWE